MAAAKTLGTGLIRRALMNATSAHHASRITHCIPSLARRSPALVVLLIAGLAALGQGHEDKQATFFMGRIKYSSNDGNDCGGVGQDLMRLVSRASTLKIQEERKVRLTDSDLFDTPFVFMNGHNDFVLTEAEVANL